MISTACTIYIHAGPYPPTFRIESDGASCKHSTPPRFVGIIQGIPLWPGYVISEFKLNIMDSSNGVTLKQFSIANNGQSDFNVTLSIHAKQLCSSMLLVSATSLSPSYGESAPAFKTINNPVANYCKFKF